MSTTIPISHDYWQELQMDTDIEVRQASASSGRPVPAIIIVVKGTTCDTLQPLDRLIAELVKVSLLVLSDNVQIKSKSSKV